jgi:hypothetical protein
MGPELQMSAFAIFAATLINPWFIHGLKDLIL